LSDQDWPALGGVATALLCLGVALKFFWRAWPAKDGEVRLPRFTFGYALFVLTVGVWLVAYGAYLQIVRLDPTGVVPIGFALLFVPPAGLVLWRWLRWRLWVEAAGIRQRRWLAASRFLDWSQIVRIRGRYFGLKLIVETAGKDKITVPLGSEGVVGLLDAAWSRSVPLVDFERFEKRGYLQLPASPGK
jgi:hypothetical protein